MLAELLTQHRTVFPLNHALSKFYLVYATYDMWEYYLINAICLVCDSPTVIEF